MAENNFLLGYGERLSSPQNPPKSGGPKNAPYTVEEAKLRIAPRIHTANERFASLPDNACPDDQVIAVVTLHPRYIAKSEYPDALLQHVGLRTVGRRPSAKIIPDKWGTKRVPEEAIVSEDLFVAGTRDVFLEWEETLQAWRNNLPYSRELVQVEHLAAFDEAQKLKLIPSVNDVATLEVALHNDFHGEYVLRQFQRYVLSFDGTVRTEKARHIGGLTFVPVFAQLSTVSDIAKFAFVRLARTMPRMRPFAPSFTRSGSGFFQIKLPETTAIAQGTRAVIFDGGLPDEALTYLQPWVNYIEPTGIGPAHPHGLSHGLAVTSSFLFGSIDPTLSMTNRPFCNVDHVRVLDENSSEDDEYYNVLDRIEHHLTNHPDDYEFVNISLGPEMPVDDNDVNPWTAMLDQLFAGREMLATVAAGNWGDKDEQLGYNRVQPPADGVNILSIGAMDDLVATSQRADYSCVGPGRSPGIVKPDGVAFGGSAKSPFKVLVPASLPTLGFEAGTSFASPFVLRSAASVRAHLGQQPVGAPELSPLAIRALLVHKSSAIGFTRKDVGWGVVPHDYRNLITSDDDEVLVIYQGELIAKKFLRLHAPLKNVALYGDVEITATILISPQVDPESASTYTRSGLDVVFRPDADNHKISKKTGKTSQYPATATFFSSRLDKIPEYMLRKESFKWEPCRKAIHSFDAAQLSNPLFDIYYHERKHGQPVVVPRPLPYVFVISVKAKETPNLYNQVRRAYSSILVPVQPQIQIQVYNGQ